MKALQAFEAAGRTGSFQAAAKELFVTPSAISHQVKSLESYLGVELFERKTRKIELTLLGRAYLHSVTGAFINIEVATQRAKVGRASGELKIAVAPAFLDRWLLPRFSDFTNRYPDIELDIHNSTGVIDFNLSDIDLAVYFGDGQWPDLDITFLRPSYLVPVCSPYLLEQERVMAPEDLLKFRLLQVRKRPDEWRTWFNLTQTPYHPSTGFNQFSSGMMAASAAAKGLGVALNDPSLVSQELESGDLMIPIELVMRLPKSFYLVSQKDRPYTHAMEQFRMWIMARMEREKADAEQWQDA